MARAAKNVSRSNAGWFATYIRKHAGTPDAAGDFIKDAREDLRLPDPTRATFPTSGGWDEVKEYLTDRNACDGAIKAARVLYERFERDWR